MINESKLLHIIEKRISDYFDIEDELIYIKRKFDSTNKIDVNSFIKSKGNISKCVENEAIHNIVTEQELIEFMKWSEFLEKIIHYYEQFENEKYKYIKNKYEKHYNKVKIEVMMSLPNATQYRLRKDILREILFYAIGNNLIKLKALEVDVKFSKVKEAYNKVFSNN